MPAALFRLNNTLTRDPAIEAWFAARPTPLGDLARLWFAPLRNAGDEVRELLHDNAPTACFGEYPFASINVFTAHLNLSFFAGATLPDPNHLLEGTGNRMRHVKLRPETPTDPVQIHALIRAAYAEIKSHVENV